MQKDIEEFIGSILGLAFLGVIILCGYYAYQITPRELYDTRKWDSAVYEHVAKVCNASPYDIKATIAYPLHEKQIGLDLVPELNAKMFFHEVKAGHFEAFFKDIFRRAVLSHTQDYTKLQVLPEKTLKSGECESIKAIFRKGRERFFVHSRPADIDDAININKEVKRFIDNNGNPGNYEVSVSLKKSTQLNWPDENTAIIFADESSDNRSWFEAFFEESENNAPAMTFTTSGIPQCELYDINHKTWAPPIKASAGTDFSSGKERIGFGCMAANNSHEFIAVFEAPGVPLVTVNNSKQITNLESALQNAATLARMVIERRENLAQAQKRQKEFLTASEDKPLLFLFGELDDPNNNTEEGIFLNSMPSHDVYGEPQTLPVGVWIQKINRQPVFGIGDFMHEMYRHALSFSEGIEKPLLITYYDGQFYRETTARFFFNPNAFKGDWSGTAVWHGLVDGLAFGQSGEVDCLASNGLKLAVNVLSELFTDGKTKVEYDDMSECVWTENTRKAIARQFHSDLYSDSSFLTVFLPTPSLFRSIAGKPIQRSANRVLGRGRVAGAVTNAIIETAEAVAFDIGTAPPGTPFGIRLKQVIQAGTPQVAASTAGVMHFVLSNRKRATRTN